MQGYGLTGDIDGDGNAAGLDYNVGGALFGVEALLDRCTTVGLLAGYAHIDTSTDSRSDEADIDSYQVGAYARHACGNHYLLGLAAYGYDDIESSRRIAFGGIARTASAEFHGHQAMAYLEGGLTLNARSVLVQPLAGVQYVHLYQNDFTESGAGALDLSVDSTDADSLRPFIGARVSRPFYTSSCVLVVPEVRAQWMREVLEDNQVVRSALVGAPANSFSARGVDLGRNFGLFGGGVTAWLNSGLSVFADYDLQAGENQTAHAGSGGVQVVW
ncbi:MAG: autotransporter outer membrane beta-barrel domain-containing protein [Planctomycetes bacterium]|nr:autotransporter outer membrane beta-barrel domain-containing protein [Planctomycetota bacterium]